MNRSKEAWRIVAICLLACCALLFALQSWRIKQVRNAYKNWWECLKAQNYGKLYQTLPDEIRTTTSEPEFSKRYDRFRTEAYGPERVLKIRVYWTEARVLFRPEGTFGESLTMKQGATGWWLEDVNGFWTTTPFE